MALSRSPLESCLQCRLLGSNPRDNEWLVLDNNRTCDSVFLRSIPGVHKARGPWEATLRNALGFLGFKYI